MKQLFLSVSQSHVSISIKLYLAVFCSKLVEIYLLNCEQVVSEKLMAGFVECLDNEEAEEGVENIGGEALSVSLTMCVCVSVFMQTTFMFQQCSGIRWANIIFSCLSMVSD